MKLRLTQRASLALLALTPAPVAPAMAHPVPPVRFCPTVEPGRRSGTNAMTPKRMELKVRLRNLIGDAVMKRLMRHADRKGMASAIDPHDVNDETVRAVLASALEDVAREYEPTSSAGRDLLAKLRSE